MKQPKHRLAPPLTETASFAKLKAHAAALKHLTLRQLFAAPGHGPNGSAERAAAFSLKRVGILLDYSKQRLTSETLRLLFSLARERKVEQMRAAMFSGAKINNTEERAALHTALRNLGEKPRSEATQQVAPAIKKTQAQLRRFSKAVRTGAWKGSTGQPVKAVVVFGIGGSYLGPKLALTALTNYHQGPPVEFVSNVDPQALFSVLKTLDAASTLFLVASKTFTTQETMENAFSARQWLVETLRRNHPTALASLKDETLVQKHFVALSTNRTACEQFGIATENIFTFWDFVGGRTSLWSAIGLPIALALGYDEGFLPLLQGAEEMDLHFESAPLAENLPVLLALLAVWENNFQSQERGATQHLVLPYSQALSQLPAHLQQLSMESNGKQVDWEGNAIPYPTAPPLWGQSGTNGQHSFYQLLHQGKLNFTADFIGFKNPCPRLVAESGSAALRARVHRQHRILLSHLLAQSEALAFGRSRAETERQLEAEGVPLEKRKQLQPHRSFEGNHPSNTLLLESLTPRSLGKLVALYEHKVFVEGVIWKVNSFDQWGVELGKTAAQRLWLALEGKPLTAHDSSTTALLAALMESSK